MVVCLSSQMTLRQMLNIADHSQLKKKKRFCNFHFKLRTDSIQQIINTMKMTFFFYHQVVSCSIWRDCQFSFFKPISTFTIRGHFHLLGKKKKSRGGSCGKGSRKFFIDWYFQISFVIFGPDPIVNLILSHGAFITLWSSEKLILLWVFHYYFP